METDNGVRLCSGCYISYLDAQKFNIEDVINFFVAHGVFAKFIECTFCKKIVTFNHKTLRYRCERYYQINEKTKQKCNLYRSVSSGTFIDSAHFPLDKIFKLTSLALFCVSPRPTSLSDAFNLSGKTLIDWFLSVREVFIDAVSRNTNKLGGKGQIIELDEAKSSKHEQLEQPWDWAYGAIDHSSQQTFLAVVEHRNSASLRDIILEKVNPGTIIVTNCLKYYSSEVFQSLEESHGFMFVKPEDSILAETIKLRWEEVCKGIHLIRRPRSVNHFAIYLFKSKYPDPAERLHAFFVAAGNLYPPTKKRPRAGGYVA